MRTPETLKQQGLWTSYISRLVGEMRRELVEQLGSAPKGRERILLDSICTKYGVLLVLRRQLKHEPILDEGGTVSGLIDRNYLTWLNALERSVELLFNGKREDDLSDLPAIDERFRTKVNNNEKV